MSEIAVVMKIALLLCYTIHINTITLLQCCYIANAVTVTQVHIISSGGRSDYVIQGENAQLSCHYLFTKPEEKIISVRWQRDGQHVYFSTPNKRPIAIDVLKGRVDFNSKDLLNTLRILNVSIGMHGMYSCHVDSDINSSQNQAFLTVIIDACKEDNWKTHTDMINCTEDISFNCVGMFPKTSPACSIYNDLTGQYIAGESFDRNERLVNNTYEISLRRRYDVREFLNFSGQLSFRCHILVMMTTWRSGIVYKLFGDPGCTPEPPKIENGSYILTGESTCWRTPRTNSRVNYTCDQGFHLIGDPTLICQNGSWVSEQQYFDLKSVLNSDKHNASIHNLKMPYCSNNISTFIFCRQNSLFIHTITFIIWSLIS